MQLEPLRRGIGSVFLRGPDGIVLAGHSHVQQLWSRTEKAETFAELAATAAKSLLKGDDTESEGEGENEDDAPTLPQNPLLTSGDTELPKTAGQGEDSRPHDVDPKPNLEFDFDDLSEFQDEPVAPTKSENGVVDAP